MPNKTLFDLYAESDSPARTEGATTEVEQVALSFGLEMPASPPDFASRVAQVFSGRATNYYPVTEAAREDWEKYVIWVDEHTPQLLAGLHAASIATGWDVPEVEDYYTSRRFLNLQPVVSFKEFLEMWQGYKIINPKKGGGPENWQVCGWYYNLQDRQLSARLLVRQVSNIPRFHGQFYFVSFERDKHRREVVHLDRGLKLAHTSPHLDEARPEPTVLTLAVADKFRRELNEVTRSRRPLFWQQREWAKVEKKALIKLRREMKKSEIKQPTP